MKETSTRAQHHRSQDLFKELPAPDLAAFFSFCICFFCLFDLGFAFWTFFCSLSAMIHTCLSKRLQTCGKVFCSLMNTQENTGISAHKTTGCSPPPDVLYDSKECPPVLYQIHSRRGSLLLALSQRYQALSGGRFCSKGASACVIIRMTFPISIGLCSG